MILANSTKWDCGRVCGRAKVGPRGSRHYHHLLITEILIVSILGHIEPHIRDCITKPSQVPRTGHLTTCQVV